MSQLRTVALEIVRRHTSTISSQRHVDIDAGDGLLEYARRVTEESISEGVMELLTIQTTEFERAVESMTRRTADPVRPIESYRHIAIGAANSVMDTHRSYYDDAVQEGLIAIWTKLQTGVTVSDSLAYVIARRRCLTMARYAGAGADMVGHARSSAGASGAGVDISSLDMRYDAPAPEVDLDTAISVRAALAELPEEVRLTAFARFWEDRPLKDLNLGRTAVGDRTAWRVRVLPALRSALSEI